MKISWSAVAAAHAKVLAAVATTATVGGGLALATTVANSHATAGLDTAQAAITSSASPSASESVSPSESPSVEPSDSPSVEPSDSASPTSTATTAGGITLPSCPANEANHGAYVSSIAQAGPAPSSSPGEFGKMVSEAARSDCGKPNAQASPGTAQSSGEQGQPSDAGQSGEHGRPSDAGRPAQSTDSNQPARPGGQQGGGDHRGS